MFYTNKYLYPSKNMSNCLKCVYNINANENLPVLCRFDFYIIIHTCKLSEHMLKYSDKR